MKKLIRGILASLILAAGLQVNVSAEELAENYTLGNSSLNILNGGIFSEEDSSIMNEIEQGNYSSLNIFPDHIYYVSGEHSICKVDRVSGERVELYQSDAAIERMFVVNDETICFVESGNAYSYNQETGERMSLRETGDIQSVIPTPYGMLYVRGDIFSWSLYAEDKLLLDSVYQYYTEEGSLVYTQDGKEYQIALERLFSTDFSSADITECPYEEVSEEEIQTHSVEEDGICEECLKNSKEYSEERYAESEKAAPGTAQEGGISAYAMSDLSKEQQQIVRRAEEQAQIEWTPLSNVKSWANEFTFESGKKYKGIPYGQPVYAKYVPYDASLAEFQNAVRDKNSKFYTDRSSYNETAPYYSSDCSAFVSWAWGLGSRNTTRTLASKGRQITGSSSEILYKLQVGDILLKAGSHTLLVEDVVYKNGQLVSVTTIEQTPPYVLRTIWGGQNSRKSLQSFVDYYKLNSNYLVYRSLNVNTENQNSSGNGNGVPVVDGVAAEDTNPHVEYETHVQSDGWQLSVKDGETAGTVGAAKRLEAIKINLKNLSNISVSYRTHVQTYGWMKWVSNGSLSGTTAESKRLEAIEIKLEGSAAKNYDIYYRVHAQTYGWLDWAKNGASAGTEGLAKRLEAIQIVLVKKGASAPGSMERPFIKGDTTNTVVTPPSVAYRTHVQTHGWQEWVSNGKTAGTTGEAKRLEGIKINLENVSTDGGIQYKTHIQTHGWGDWVSNGEMSGTEGQAKRLEAIRIQLTGSLANEFDIYYRVHSQTYGWLGWAKNGEEAGTEGLAKRLEAIEIKVVKKNESAPGSTERRFVKK
ncbi:MAG: hypothetical protein HFH53_03900 [Hespellia sp.]|nr:hypothetical protein [Hespellia sp.]